MGGSRGERWEGAGGRDGREQGRHADHLQHAIHELELARPPEAEVQHQPLTIRPDVVVFAARARGVKPYQYIHGRNVSLNTFDPGRYPSTGWWYHSTGAGGASQY